MKTTPTTPERIAQINATLTAAAKNQMMRSPAAAVSTLAEAVSAINDWGREIVCNYMAERGLPQHDPEPEEYYTAEDVLAAVRAELRRAEEHERNLRWVVTRPERHAPPCDLESWARWDGVAQAMRRLLMEFAPWPQPGRPSHRGVGEGDAGLED